MNFAALLLVAAIVGGCSSNSATTRPATTQQTADGFIDAGSWSASIEQNVLRIEGIVNVAATNYAAELKLDSVRMTNSSELVLIILIKKTGNIGGMMITERPVRYEDRKNLNVGRACIVYPNGTTHTIELR